VPENSQELHEDPDVIGPDTRDRHRAIASLMEEMEAVDWYQQRVDAATDASLRAILAHNAKEEKEHAAMVLEWLRRHDPELDANLRTYLFTSAPITEVEGEEEGGGGSSRGPTAGAGSLGIGSLRGAAQ
jgi:ferritin-like protein